MKGQHVFRLFALLALVMGGLALPATAAPLAQTPTQARTAQERALLDELARATDNQATVARHAGTGLVRFIGTTKDHAVARPSSLPAQASSSSVAAAYLAQYGALFGLNNPSRELSAYRATTMADGRQSVRFQQQYQGLPVIAGQLNVQLTKDQELLAIGGETLTGLDLDVTPAVSPTQAQANARALVAKHYGVAARDLQVATPELSLYNPVLLGAPGFQTTSLVWRVEVRGESATTAIREFVLVDGQTGGIALNFNQIAEAKERHVCDSNNVPDTDGNENNDCEPADYVRNEGDPPSAVQDINLAYDYSGDTYDFYNAMFGRDSIDGAGMPLISLVRYCPDANQCPYQNAFWNGSQMTYGNGFATANDVVAHELTHGVTENSSNLFYYFQSGALNESLSDIFGEFVDQLYSTNSAAERWELGEDIGGIRNMQNPPLFGHPDRMNSPLYVLDPTQADNGGVHSNSGVSNKSAYLMTDGDTFNGFTITGLGITKTAHIYYEVEVNMLTSGSDYADYGSYLRQACANLTGSFGITAADCDEVNKVVLATEMDQVPSNSPAPEAEICRPGQTVNDIYYDPIVMPNTNWAALPVSGVANSWTGATGGYATSGLYAMYNQASPGVQDSAIAQVAGIQLPANAYLHFRHAYDFEADASSNYDGGVVEYSTDAGVTWNDASPLFTAQGYNGMISSASNPLDGQKAFVNVSHGYISSRLDLSSLSGSAVRFRFRAASDDGGAALGWLIDDVRIYTCDGSGTRSNPYGFRVGDVTLEQGTGPVTATVATVSDAEQTAGSLAVEASNAPAGMTVNLTNDDGLVSAQVLCACTVEPGVYPIDVTVTNSDNLTGTVSFNVEVTPAGQVVQDPSFEAAGVFWSGFSSTYSPDLPIPFCNTSFCFGNPRTGSAWIRMGGRNGMVDTSSVSQTLDLDTGAANLSFYLTTFVHSGNGDADYLEVLFDNTVVFSVTDSSTAYDADYMQVNVALGNVTAGQHTLEFRSHNEAAATAVRFSVDDVYVISDNNICATANLQYKLYMPLVLR